MIAWLKNLPLPSSPGELVKNSFFIFSVRILQKLLGAVTLFFLVRSLSQDAFAHYNLILSVIGFMSLFTLPGLNNAIIQSRARGFGGTFRKALPVSMLVSVAGSLIIAAIAVYFYFDDQEDLANGFIIAAILLPLSHAMVQWKCIWMGDEKFKSLSNVSIANSIIKSVLMIFFIWLIPGSFFWPLLVFLLLPAIQNIRYTLLMMGQIPKSEPAEDGALAYGIKTSFYASFNAMAVQVDKLMIFLCLSPAALAIYVVAEKVPEGIKALIGDLALVIGPRLSKHNEYTPRLEKIFLIFSIVAGTGIIAIAFLVLPWGIPLVFGEEYNVSVPYAQALMCTIAFANVSPLRYQFLLSRIDPQSIKTVNVVMSLTRIASAVILIPFFGIVGAVISAFIHRIASTVAVQVIIRKRYPFPKQAVPL